MPGPITEEIVELVASGVDAYVATVDADLQPESMLVMGVRINADRSGLTVYLPAASCEQTRKNLGHNPALAVTMIRPQDLKAVQLKGRATKIRESTETEREFQAIFRAAMIEQFEIVGIPRSSTRRLVWWPSIAVEAVITDVFAQTPGPRAGEPLAAR